MPLKVEISNCIDWDRPDAEFSLYKAQEGGEEISDYSINIQVDFH